MECPSCYELFNEKNRIPRNLRCGHTFCQDCLQILEKSKKFNCPICRFQNGPFSSIDLPRNYIALQLAGKEERKKETDLCRIHKTEYLRLFCHTCGEGICPECIVEHSGHSFVKLEESTHLFKSKVEELSLIVSEAMESTKKQMNQLDGLINEIESQKEETLESIDKKFERLMIALDERRQQLKEQYESMVSSEVRKVEEQIKLYNQSLDQLKQINLAFGDTLDQLPEAAKLNNPRAKQTDIEQKAKLVKEIQQKAEKAHLPYANLPYLMINMQDAEEAIDKSISLIPSSEDYAYNKKICFFGDKNKVLKFELESETWTTDRLANSLFYINYYGAAVSLPNGNILVVGGGSTTSTYLYNEKTNTLTKMAPMNQMRKEHAVVRIGGDVYTMGGYDSQRVQFLGSCEKLNIFENKWSPIANLNIGRCAFAATVVNYSHIYICGGYDGDQRLDTIEHYDGSRWKIISTHLPIPLSNLAAFSPCHDTLVILGGGLSSGFYLSMELLDLKTANWETLTPLANGRDLRNKVIVSNYSAYAIGGNAYAGEKYQLQSKLWAPIPNYPLLNNLDSFCCALSFELPALLQMSMPPLAPEHSYYPKPHDEESKGEYYGV